MSTEAMIETAGIMIVLIVVAIFAACIWTHHDQRGR